MSWVNWILFENKMHCVWLAAPKKYHETRETKQNTGEHSDSRMITTQVRTDVTGVPAKAPAVNATISISQNRVEHNRYQLHDMGKDFVTNDVASHTSNWAVRSLTLSFRLRGDVVNLHLTRSKSQASHSKVLVGERGRIRRWASTSPNDVGTRLITVSSNFADSLQQKLRHKSEICLTIDIIFMRYLVQQISQFSSAAVV